MHQYTLLRLLITYEYVQQPKKYVLRSTDPSLNPFFMTDWIISSVESVDTQSSVFHPVWIFMEIGSEPCPG